MQLENHFELEICDQRYRSNLRFSILSSLENLRMKHYV